MFNLRYQLAATGLYSDDDPVSRGELKAYERQLNDFLAWQQKMKREFALNTTELLIERWEKIYDEHPLPTDTLRDRQIRLLNKRRAKGVLTPAKVIAFAGDYGYQAKIQKHVRPFCYRVEVLQSDVDLQKLDEVLTRSEPGHQTHDFGFTTPTEVIKVDGYARNFDVKYPRCGTFRAKGDATGSLAISTVAVVNDARGFEVKYPRCGTFVAGRR